MLAEEERRRLAEEAQARLAESEVPQPPAAAAAADRRRPGAAGGSRRRRAARSAGSVACRQAALPGPCCVRAATGGAAQDLQRTGRRRRDQVGQQALQQHELEPRWAAAAGVGAGIRGTAASPLPACTTRTPGRLRPARSPSPTGRRRCSGTRRRPPRGCHGQSHRRQTAVQERDNGFERSQGRTYLEQAANAGSDEAKQLLPICQ